MRLRIFITICAFAPLLSGIVKLHAVIMPDSNPPDQTIVMNGNDAGRVFDGVGAISSSSSLLLYDYPKRERDQILDYLFKPNYGASLQILKVEIGSDTNSTTSSEPDHMRTPNDLNCHRGIEWWLMKQALARNPKIKLYGLMWGAPGWFKGGLWSDDHVRYLETWLGCAKENGLHIDYLGGANERYHPAPQASFFVALHKALATTYPDIKIVATDEHIPPDYWRVATQIKTDPSYRAAVNILGEHDVCHWRSRYKHCDASQDALTSGKPLWNNEQSSQDAAAGAGPLARAMNRNYIDARLTANINWAMVASFYGNTATGGQGLMLAEIPWSGDYRVN
jgi:O-glycosyl hydrolase